MDEHHISPNPLGNAAASEDQVSLAVNALLTAAATSVALFSLVTWGTVQLIAASGVTDVTQVTPNSFATNFVSFGAVAAIIFSAIVAWSLLWPVRSNFRRGGVSIVATLAGTVLSVVLTSAARWALASQGLLLLLVIAVITALFFFRRTRAATLALPSQQR